MGELSVIKYVRKVCMYSLAPFNDWSIHVQL